MKSNSDGLLKVSEQFEEKDPEDSDTLQAIRRTLLDEAAAITALADAVDARFVSAIDLIDKIDGRVVVTGIGKSGHIARKIAATLASTGTPSFFVHPAEASHGDLGMISIGDCVIALSNSGNTHELVDTVNYCKRFAIPLIGITSKANSMLGQNSDVPLVLPQRSEACPMGLAPTTSTTMMLALGDAIAIALLERRNFTSEGFRDFHPGGQLGQRLLTVRDLMLPTESLPVVEPDSPVADVIVQMTSKNYGCAIVVDQNLRLRGLITDGDLRRHLGGNLLGKTAAEIMTLSPQAVPPTLLVAEAVNRMNKYRITSLCVLEGDRLVGLVHMHDCLRKSPK